MKNATDETGPRMLPVLYYRGKLYFVDERLREFRNTENFDDAIRFGTAEGSHLYLNALSVRCTNCGQEAMRLMDQLKKRMVCFRCGKRYTVTWGVNVFTVPPD